MVWLHLCHSSGLIVLALYLSLIIIFFLYPSFSLSFFVVNITEIISGIVSSGAHSKNFLRSGVSCCIRWPRQASPCDISRFSSKLWVNVRVQSCCVCCSFISLGSVPDLITVANFFFFFFIAKLLLERCLLVSAHERFLCFPGNMKFSFKAYTTNPCLWICSCVLLPRIILLRWYICFTASQLLHISHQPTWARGLYRSTWEFCFFNYSMHDLLYMLLYECYDSLCFSSGTFFKRYCSWELLALLPIFLFSPPMTWQIRLPRFSTSLGNYLLP